MYLLFSCCVRLFCDPVGYSPPGSQARILEWIARPLPRGLPNPGIEPMSLQFYSQRSGEGEKTFFVFHQQTSFFHHHQCLLQVGQGSFFVPTWSSQVHKLLFFFYVFREHVLGIANLLSSLGRMWFLCHHCFVVWGRVSHFCCMVLLLSKPAWFCG